MTESTEELGTESASEPSDFSYICRLCLGNGESDMEEIFPLSEKVEFVTRMAVTVGDGLPTFICQHCIFELDSANNFIARCINNESLLRAKLVSVCPDTIIVKEEILEVNGDNVIDYENTIYEDTTNQDDDNQHVTSDLKITHTASLQTYSPSYPEPACGNFADMFGVVNIIETPADAFVTEIAEENPIVEQSFLSPLAKANTVKMYTCKLCDESFNIKTYFILHMKSHGLCVPSISSTDDNEETITTEYEEEDNFAEIDFNCRVCGQSFVEERDLRLHERCHDVVKRIYGCSKCQKKFRDELRLKLHIQSRHHDKKSSVKQITAKRVPVRKVKEPRVPRQTPATKRVLSTKSRQQSSVKKSPVKSEVPSTSMGSKTTVVKCETLEELPYHCLTCSKLFKTNKAMLLHARCHKKKPTPLSFPCSSCSKVFTTEKEMLTHASSHVKAHECSKCGKRFASRTKLKLHATKHSNISCFKCAKCGEEFGNRLHLNHHKRFHEDEKPYKCSECAESFVDEGGLLCHFVVHAIKREELPEKVATPERVESCGTKPKASKGVTVSCEICGRDFTKKSALAMHMKVHAVHKCSKCGEEFETKKLLAAHFPFHDEDNPYKCAKCGSSCADEAAMFEHFKTHIKVETNDL